VTVVVIAFTSSKHYELLGVDTRGVDGSAAGREWEVLGVAIPTMLGTVFSGLNTLIFSGSYCALKWSVFVEVKR
jgi:hypothetical protein